MNPRSALLWRLPGLALWRRVGLALWLVAVGCRSAAPVPLLGYSPLVAGTARLLPACPVLGTENADLGSPWMAVYEYPRSDPAGVVLLVHGLGTNAHLWDLPGFGGLAPRLWQEGYAVFSVDHSSASRRGCPSSRAVANQGEGLESLAAHLGSLLIELGRRFPGRPLFAIGHDMGGTALYLAAGAKEVPIQGVVGIAAPLSTVQGTRAQAAVLEQARRYQDAGVDWEYLGHLQPEGFPAHGDLERALLFRSLPPARKAAFYRFATAPLPDALLSSLNESGPSPLPTRALLDGLSARPELAVLVLLSPSDGLCPPWQADPATLGLRRTNIQRLYFTRANGHEMEYSHFDLLLHPAAAGDVFPAVLSFLAAARRSPRQNLDKH